MLNIKKGWIITSDSKKTLYERRKEQGLCVQCGKPNDKKGTRCKVCTQKSTEYARERREKRRLLGLCPRCGKELMGDEVNCIECQAVNYVFSIKWKAENEEKNREYARERNKRIYEQRKAENVCCQCGGKKDADKYSFCKKCRDKRKPIKKRYRERHAQPKVKDVWIEKGLCVRCGNERKKGYKLCERCYQKNVDALHSEKCVEWRNEVRKASYNNYQFRARAKAGDTNG